MSEEEYKNIDLTKFIFKINFTHHQKIANCFPKIKLKGKNNKYNAVVSNHPFWANTAGYSNKILVLTANNFYDLYCKQFFNIHLTEEKQKHYCKVLTSRDIDSIKLAYNIIMNSYFENHLDYKAYFLSFLKSRSNYLNLKNIDVYDNVIGHSKDLSIQADNFKRLMLINRPCVFNFTQTSKKYFEWFTKVYINKFTSLKSYKIEYSGTISNSSSTLQKFTDILTENF